MSVLRIAAVSFALLATSPASAAGSRQIIEGCRESVGKPRRLDQVNTSLALFDRPARFLFLNGGIYVVLPALLLLAAHFVVVMKFDWPQLYLRIASVIIPLPFGMAAYAFSRIGYRAAFGLGR
jgi:hypothetical protein